MIRPLVVCCFSCLLASTAPAQDTSWPPLTAQFPEVSAQSAVAAVPLPREMDTTLRDKLIGGKLLLDGKPIQAQTVAYYEDEKTPRRVVLRWISDKTLASVAPALSDNAAPAADAGWSFGYTWLEGNKAGVDTLPWLMRLKNSPIDQTHYEMYQLDLKHGDKSLGFRLGIRHNNRIFWWQFVRADFIQRGPVCDILRAGGPVYNEQSTLQGDVYFILYANGTIDVTVHFANHQREGVGIDINGVPVIAFDIPGKPTVEAVLDGTQPRYELGACKLNLAETVHMADKERPGSLKTEGDAVVLQPWLDQQVFGGRLVYDENIPEHRIMRKGGTTAELTSKEKLGESDTFWAATIGDKLIPSGLARSCHFTLSIDAAAPVVARYDAPGWWHAQCQAIPNGNRLPVSWWMVPHALKVCEGYFAPQDPYAPFEYGRRGHDGDGTIGAAMLALGSALDVPKYNDGAMPACYWWADVPINHVDFTVREIPYFGWQWIVQPYLRSLEVTWGYWQTGDPYLFETSEFTSDAFYRFFRTNRPHRFVGRDCLPVFELLALYQTTGEKLYLNRAEKVLAEGRRSYSQLEFYWPGHQSGSGTNGVARIENWEYMPFSLARTHLQLIEAARGTLSAKTETDSWDFMKFIANEVDKKGNQPQDNGWQALRMALAYPVVTALADKFPEENAHWSAWLNKWNTTIGMPDAHSGAKAYEWVSGALTFDAWAWGAKWEGGKLTVKPQKAVLDDPRAPKQCRVSTPVGPVDLAWDGTAIAPVGTPPCEVVLAGS
jgi:hypothetical protein